MYEKLTKARILHDLCPKNIFSRILGAAPASYIRLWLQVAAADCLRGDRGPYAAGEAWGLALQLRLAVTSRDQDSSASEHLQLGGVRTAGGCEADRTPAVIIITHKALSFIQCGAVSGALWVSAALSTTTHHQRKCTRQYIQQLNLKIWISEAKGVRR